MTSLDGAAKRHVSTLLRSTRALDLRGSLLALASDEDLVILDLASGSDQRVTVGPRLSSGLIGPDGLVMLHHARRLRGRVPGDARPRVDSATGDARTSPRLKASGADLAWQDPASGDVMVVPRGCDVGTSHALAARREDRC